MTKIFKKAAQWYLTACSQIYVHDSGTHQHK